MRALMRAGPKAAAKATRRAKKRTLAANIFSGSYRIESGNCDRASTIAIMFRLVFVQYVLVIISVSPTRLQFGNKNENFHVRRQKELMTFAYFVT